MSCGNPYKHMMQNTYTPFIDAMSSEKNLNYEKIGVYAIWYMRL